VIQEQLFDIPVQTPVTQSTSKLPPSPPNPAMIAEPLGPCAKLGCNKPAVLASPSGNPKSVYCKQHGHCGRANKDGLETCGTRV